MLVVGPEISLENIPVSAAGADYALVPGHGPHPTEVTAEGPDYLAVVGIPDLGVSTVGAHCEVRPPGVPTHTGDAVVLTYFTQFSHSRGAGRPNINSPTKPHREDIA